jgi:hypothetical protein
MSLSEALGQFAIAGVMALGISATVPAATKSLPSPEPSPAEQQAFPQNTFVESPTNQPRRLRFSLTLASPEDLKVRQGDSVQAGQILSDRDRERSRLVAQKQQLTLKLQQIEAQPITAPPPPVSVPKVKNLPPVSFSAEETAITTTAREVEQARRALQLHQSVLKGDPLEASSTVSKAEVEVQNRQRLLDNQRRKIDALALLKDLPAEVAAHEQEVVKQREAELQQAQSDHRQAQAKLQAAVQAQAEKLQQLTASLEQAQGNHQLAIAKLQSARDQRAYTEYEASVTAARRAEEANQAQIAYSRQLQEVEGQKRDRAFQIAQLQAKAQEVDNAIAQLSTIRSPYSGTIKRVKWSGQSDHNLTVELVLAISGTSSDGANTPTSQGSASSPSSRTDGRGSGAIRGGPIPGARGADNWGQ